MAKYVAPDKQKLTRYEALDINNHSLYLETDGIRDGNYQSVNDPTAYMDNIFATYHKYKADNPKLTITIYIHGGLLPIQSTMHRAKSTYQLMLEDDQYPIYLNWDSTMQKAVVALYSNPLEPLFTVPIGAASMILHSPLYYYDMLVTSNSLLASKQTLLESKGVDLNYNPNSQHEMSVGEVFSYLNPIKMVATPLVYSIAPSIWGALKQEVIKLFGSPNAQVDYLLNRLTQEQLPTTLIGYSMGAIAANNIIQRFAHINYQSISYQGAACSIKSVRDSVFPLLRLRPNVEFYSTSIHEAHEIAQLGADGWAQNGSLIRWIDEFIQKEPNPINRRLGNWENTQVLIDSVPQELKSRVHLSRFDFDHSNNVPHSHDTLFYYRFWKESFWRAQQPERITTRP
jgi:hypothetical protein